jgi:hypothetical protein
MSTFKPNQCPRCGYAYSPWMQTHLPMGERMKITLRHGATPWGHARGAQELQQVPWTCTCGAVLRRRAWRFDMVDVAGIVVVTALWVFGAVRVPWLRSPYVGGLAIGLWVMVRTALQFGVEEVNLPPPPITA